MSSPGPVALRREHIATLCQEHDVAVEYQPKGKNHARAWPAERRVLIPQTTMVRSYYLGLHEIGHCVVGYDYDRPAAPQEAATWQWAVEHAIEPPTLGLKRMMFKVLWHYLLHDLGVWDGEQLSNRDLFPAPDDPFWSFLASLDDDAGRLLYEATKITARTGPSAQWRAHAYQELDLERRRSEEAVERAKENGRRALIREQLRFYGPPEPANAGERVLVGTGEKAHIWRYEGQYGAMTRISAIYCGATGVAHPARDDAPACRVCERLSRTVSRSGTP